MIVDGLLSVDSSVTADKVKELKAKITDLEKDNTVFKYANKVLQGIQASLESLVASKDGKIVELKEEMSKQVEQFHAREAEIEAAVMARFQKGYLLFSSGQSFLKTIQKELLEAFLNNHIFLTKLKLAAKQFYFYSFNLTKEQAEKLGCQGEFDHKTPLLIAPSEGLAMG